MSRVPWPPGSSFTFDAAAGLGEKLASLLPIDDLALIGDYIWTSSFDLCNGTFHPLTHATPKGAKLFSLVNVPSLQLRYFPVTKQQFSSMWSRLKIGINSGINLQPQSNDDLLPSLFLAI